MLKTSFCAVSLTGRALIDQACGTSPRSEPTYIEGIEGISFYMGIVSVREPFKLKVGCLPGFISALLWGYAEKICCFWGTYIHRYMGIHVMVSHDISGVTSHSDNVSGSKNFLMRNTS